MKLTTGTVVRIKGGVYTFNVIISTGTSVFNVALDNINYAPVDDSSLSATGNGTITLPSCSFKATLGGDAEAWLVKV
jgi:hypothetical protein